ncbi:hypothetical protein D7D52_36625 [Nocardia yunnanensis]|uniref:Uncharacterized protein n=1 Tax=Nocardia yunnanensis TaxID=2382165 RepID=A0A386ZMP4_9NOCA|nr:hypothetical protein D7D52_36625 [Nocardia yunnanensis]
MIATSCMPSAVGVTMTETQVRRDRMISGSARIATIAAHAAARMIVSMMITSRGSRRESGGWYGATSSCTSDWS